MWQIKESKHKASGQGAMKSMMECTMPSHWCICVWMYMTRILYVHQPSYLNACLPTGVRACVWMFMARSMCSPTFILGCCFHTGAYVCVHVHDNEHNMCKPSYLHAPLHWCKCMCVHVHNKEHTQYVCQLSESVECVILVYTVHSDFNQNCHTKQLSLNSTSIVSP